MQLKAIMKNLNAYTVLEQSHLNNVELTNEMHFMLQLLVKEIESANIRNILLLLLNPMSNCHFIPKLNSCIKIRAFSKLNKSSVQINFLYLVAKQVSYRLVLCMPKYINGLFLISTAHNTKVYEKGIIDTSNLRNVSVKDYIIPKLAVIGIDMFLKDKSCSMLICMTNLTFLQNEDIKSCVKTENITICGEFTLSFEQGTISHVNIADQNLHA